MFWPPKSVEWYSADSLELLYRDKFRFVQTQHNTEIPTVFFRPREADANENRLTVIYSHANAEDLASTINFCFHLSERCKVNVITYDYTGYGISRSKVAAALVPSEMKVYNDILAVYTYALRDLGLNPDSIVLMGRSLGTVRWFGFFVAFPRCVDSSLSLSPLTPIPRLHRLSWLPDMQFGR